MTYRSTKPSPPRIDGNRDPRHTCRAPNEQTSISNRETLNLRLPTEGHR